jgi:hypothetical protein
MDEMIGLSVLGGVDTLLIATIAWLAVRLRDARDAARMCRQDMSTLSRDVQALCEGANAMSAHLARLQQQSARLMDRQDRLECRDFARREYDDAIGLARKGCDAEQLMAKCGLGRAEAEMLAGLYGRRDQVPN